MVPVFSLGVLASGLLPGWGSKWGVLRYRWVVVKLTLAVIMVVLVFVSLVPAINDLKQSDGALSGSAVRDSLGSAPTQLLFPLIVSYLMLGTSAVLAVFTPWGRTRWSMSKTA